TWRTLEQKIADAGPYNQRIDPHLLTPARKSLESERLVVPHRPPKARASFWFHLRSTPAETINARLAEQLPVFQAMLKESFTVRLGQTLEIAIWRALLQQPLCPIS
ncbi:MAG: hypothetical protein ACREPW_09685, partial [Candidatus Binataceae bacterium]